MDGKNLALVLLFVWRNLYFNKLFILFWLLTGTATLKEPDVCNYQEMSFLTIEKGGKKKKTASFFGGNFFYFFPHLFGHQGGKKKKGKE